MTCLSSPGASHYACCACHEARWAEKLAAAEARAKRYEEALNDYLDWGAMTGSDRDLFINRFRRLLGRPEGYYCDRCRCNVATEKHDGCRHYAEKPARAALAPPPEGEVPK